MKKIAIIFLLFVFLSISLPAFAGLGFFKPNSRLYFLQSFSEEVKLFFTFSKERKAEYLLELTERRTDEARLYFSATAAARYENHFVKLEELADEVGSKEVLAENIKQASLRQQAVLADVYVNAPYSEEALNAIVQAQENSSQHVEKIIESVQGEEQAKEYMEQTAQIMQIEKMERQERVEQVPMEQGPGGEPSESSPKEIQPGKELKEGQPMNPLNPVLENQNQASGSGQTMQPVAPVPIGSPTNQQ